jgi:hypothetical protein
LLGLWANIPKVQALRELEARRVDSPLTFDRLYALKLAATGSKSEAQDAAAKFMAAQLRAGHKPE